MLYLTKQKPPWYVLVYRLGYFLIIIAAMIEEYKRPLYPYELARGYDVSAGVWQILLNITILAIPYFTIGRIILWMLRYFRGTSTPTDNLPDQQTPTNVSTKHSNTLHLILYIPATIALLATIAVTIALLPFIPTVISSFFSVIFNP